MIRFSLVSVVEHPDITDIQDLVLAITEEFGKVLSRFGKLRKPDHSWQVRLTTLHVGALKTDGVGSGSDNGLCHRYSRSRKGKEDG
jgi:hypothetical protein